MKPQPFLVIRFGYFKVVMREETGFEYILVDGPSLEVVMLRASEILNKELVIPLVAHE